MSLFIHIISFIITSLILSLLMCVLSLSIYLPLFLSLSLSLSSFLTATGTFDQVVLVLDLVGREQLCAILPHLTPSGSISVQGPLLFLKDMMINVQICTSIRWVEL